MRSIKSFLFALLLLTVVEPAFSQSTTKLSWWNPVTSTFPVIEGQGWHSGLKHPYDRLPATAEKSEVGS